MRILNELICLKCLEEYGTLDEHSIDTNLFIIFLLGSRVTDGQNGRNE